MKFPVSQIRGCSFMHPCFFSLKTLDISQNSMQEKDGSYMEHSGGNPNFSTMLYIDRDRNIWTFAATYISSDSPVNAARSAYKLMTEGKFEHMSASPSLDSIAAPIAVVFLLLLVLLVVLLLTQKKRLAKKAVNMKKEKIKAVSQADHSVGITCIMFRRSVSDRIQLSVCCSVAFLFRINCTHNN